MDDEGRGALSLRHPGAVLCSAVTGLGIEELIERLAHEAAAQDRLIDVELPYREGALAKLVHEQGHIMVEEYNETGVHLVAKVSPRIAGLLGRYATAP